MTPDHQAAPLSAEELAEAHPHWRLGVEHMAWHRRWIAHWKARAEAAESALTAERKAKASPPLTLTDLESCSVLGWKEAVKYEHDIGRKRAIQRLLAIIDRLTSPQEVSAAKVEGGEQ